MRLLPCFFFALLTGLIGATYGGVMAEASVRWLRIPGFEGEAGYHVLAMIVFAFLASTVAGLIIGAFVGGPGLRGIARGFGASLAAMFLVISGLGFYAWVGRDVPPLIGGERIALAIEIRWPADVPRPEPGDEMPRFLDLQSGPKPRRTVARLRFDEAREEDGRWIVPATVPLHVSEDHRILAVTLLEGTETQFFDTGIPARPATMHMNWSPWFIPFRSDLSPVPAENALGARVRVIPEPPPPTQPEFALARAVRPVSSAPTKG